MIDRPLYLGIDGGGTSCRARLVDHAGAVLGEGQGGPSNARLGAATLSRAILAATTEALAAAGLDETAFGRIEAGFGLAGAGQPAGRSIVDSIAWPFRRWTVATDVEVACLGAHGGDDGGILVIGTGSCGFARVGGRRHFVGGWGFPISDQGSAAWLGLEAIRAALQAHDGVIAGGAMTEAVLTRFGGAAPIVAWLDAARPGDFGALAPLVLASADSGDARATEILDQAIADIGVMIATLSRLKVPRLSLSGGLASTIEPRLPPESAMLLSLPLADALSGAVRLAMRE